MRVPAEAPDTIQIAAPVTSPGRVIAALAGLLVLVVIGIGIGVWTILDQRAVTTDLTEREIEYAAAIGDIALISKTLANDERGFLISGEPEFRRQFDGRTAQAYEAYQRAYANAGAQQWVAVNEAEETFERWLRATQANMDVYAQGDRDAAVQASLDETRLLRKEYEARLTGMESLAAFSIESATREVTSTLTRSVAILLGYLVVAIVVGAAIAGWLLRETLRPTRELLRLTAEADARARETAARLTIR